MKYKVTTFQRTDNFSLELQNKINTKRETGYRYNVHESSEIDRRIIANKT